MELTKRQHDIVNYVEAKGPVSGDDIAAHLGLSKSTLRTDLSFLSHLGWLVAKPKVGYVVGDKGSWHSEGWGFEHMKVARVMSMPEVVEDKVTLHDAIATLFLADVGSIYVHRNHQLVGVVSRKDLIKCLMGGNDALNMPITMAMTRMPNVHYVTPDTSVLDACKMLVEYEIDSLPVVNQVKGADGLMLKVVGRMSKTIIAKLMVENC